MSTQRIGTADGMDIPVMKVVPIISLAVVHNGIVLETLRLYKLNCAAGGHQPAERK